MTTTDPGHDGARRGRGARVEIPPLTPREAAGFALARAARAAYLAPDTIVLCFSANVFRGVRSQLRLSLDGDWPFCRHPYRRLFRGGPDGNFGLMHIEIGFPVATFVLELLFAFGTRRIVLVTAAGAISDALREGEHFVIDRAYHGGPPASGPTTAEHATASAATAVLRAAAREDLAFRRVASFSSETFTRREPWRARFRGAPPDIVEMEAATVYRLGRQWGASVVAFGVVSDVYCPRRRAWVREQPQEYVKRQRRLGTFAASLFSDPSHSTGVAASMPRPSAAVGGRA